MLFIGVRRYSAVYKVLGGTVMSIGVGRDSAVYRCWE